MTALEVIQWAQDPLQECGGQPVIVSTRFELLAEQLTELDEIPLSKDELLKLLYEQSKRFTACGANNVEKYGVIRRNPEQGWNQLLGLIKRNPE